MVDSGRKIKKGIFVITYVVFSLYFLWQVVLHPLMDAYIPLGPIYTDVAKRVESPDGKKTALLIRRNAFDLNYGIKIKEGMKARTLFWTGDFVPDMGVDWNEKIIWSDDSSFIVMVLDKPAYDRYYKISDTQKGTYREENIKYMCAYDFKDHRRYDFNEKYEIISIMNSRCKEKRLDETEW
ncbi:MAG: hypothetical protein WC374_06255 [Phycisphaerae bacterium]|jgi:hypothetical protein